MSAAFPDFVGPVLIVLRNRKLPDAHEAVQVLRLFPREDEAVRRAAHETLLGLIDVLGAVEATALVALGLDLLDATPCRLGVGVIHVGHRLALFLRHGRNSLSRNRSQSLRRRKLCTLAADRITISTVKL